MSQLRLFKRKQFTARHGATDRLVLVPELEVWQLRIRGKYRWCTRCRVARVPHAHNAHLSMHANGV